MKDKEISLEQIKQSDDFQKIYSGDHFNKLEELIGGLGMSEEDNRLFGITDHRITERSKVKVSPILLASQIQQELSRSIKNQYHGFLNKKETIDFHRELLAKRNTKSLKGNAELNMANLAMNDRAEEAYAEGEQTNLMEEKLQIIDIMTNVKFERLKRRQNDIQEQDI